MLYYYQANNFGDDLNPWLWPRLAPELVEERSDRLFLGIGTILNRKIPAGPRKFVFGTGWDGERPVRMGPEWRIHGVRGPLTAAGLGLPAETALSDPGLLVRRFVKRPPGATGRGVAFMPHHCSVGAVEWKPLCEARGLAYIDPEQPVDKVLPAIDGCRVLLAEAMHGAIVADALGVPWIPVRISGRINEFKWRDWCSSLGLTCRPVRLPPLHARLPTGMSRTPAALEAGAGPDAPRKRKVETAARTGEHGGRDRAGDGLSRRASPALRPAIERSVPARRSRGPAIGVAGATAS